MTTSWDIKPLSEVSGFQGGSQPPKSRFVSEPREGYVRLLQIRDFKRDDKAVYIPVAKKNRTCTDGDIMIGRYGASVGQIHRGKSGAYNVALIKTIPNDELIDRDYFYYYLTSPHFQKPLMDVSERSAQAGFSKDDIAGFQVSLPLLSEQKRIVAILDEAFAGIDAAIANTEKNLANARELFESYLNAVFTQRGEGWVEKTLNDVVTSSCSLSYGIVQPGNDFNGGLPVVRPTDLRKKIIMAAGLKKIDPALASSYVRTTLFGGDLLLCVRGSTGVLSIASDELKGANVTRGIVPIRFDTSIIGQSFGYYLLSSNYVQAQIKEKTYGAALMQINIRDLKKIDVAFPKLDLQESLVEKISVLDADTKQLESIYQQKLKALNELKQSLLKKAFSGELTSTIIDTTSPECAANIIALAYHHHALKKRDKSFGHVKAQKTLHLMESIGGVDLGRFPIKDAAGPNDFPHMLKAKEWAMSTQFFEFQERTDGKGYIFKKGKHFDQLLAEAIISTKAYAGQLEKIIDLVIPMNKLEVEVFTTVHAAWNNLLLDGVDPDDEAIIREARENWHPDKVKISLARFRDSIRLIRNKGLVPDGSACRVGGQEAMFV